MKKQFTFELDIPAGYEPTGEIRPPNNEYVVYDGQVVKLTSKAPYVILRRMEDIEWWPEWLTAGWIYRDSEHVWKATNVEPVYVESGSQYSTGWWETCEVGGVLNASELDLRHVNLNPPVNGLRTRHKNPRNKTPTSNHAGTRTATVQSYKYADDDYYGAYTGSRSTRHSSLYGSTPSTPSSAETSAASAISAALKDIKLGVTPSSDSSAHPTDPKTQEEADEFLSMARSRLEKISNDPAKVNEVMMIQETVDRVSKKWEGDLTTDVVPITSASKKNDEVTSAEEAEHLVDRLNRELNTLLATPGGLQDLRCDALVDAISDLCKTWGIAWPSDWDDTE